MRVLGRSRAWLLVALLLAGSATADEVRLERIETDSLVIVYERPFERTARELARRGPAELSRLGRALGLPPPPRAEVHLLPRKGGGDPRERGLPLGPDWSAGLTLGARPVIILRTAEDHAGAGGTSVSQVFAHELVHLIAIQALGEHHAALPAWLKEGTASHLAFEWRMADSGHALRFALGRSFVPLSRLRYGFSGNAEQIRDAYFESRAFVGWLIDDGGPEAFRRLWGRLQSGEDFDRAFYEVYGTRVRDQEDRWRRHFMRRYAWLPLLTSATTPWVVVMALVFVGWFGKRRSAKDKLARWEEEDRALDAAGDEEATDGEEGEDGEDGEDGGRKERWP